MLYLLFTASGPHISHHKLVLARKSPTCGRSLAALACVLGGHSTIPTQEASYGGVERSGRFVITDVWVQRDGRWQLTLRHSTRVTAG
jgi:hypothetical protein